MAIPTMASLEKAMLCKVSYLRCLHGGRSNAHSSSPDKKVCGDNLSPGVAHCSENLTLTARAYSRPNLTEAVLPTAAADPDDELPSDHLKIICGLSPRAHSTTARE